MKTLRHFSPLLLMAWCVLGLYTKASHAQGAITALDTNGIVYAVDQKTGALTAKTEEAFTSFSLGGSARRKGKFYYVVAPAGLTENAIFTSVPKKGTLSHVDLDRSEDVRVLFFVGRKLYGVFYDGTAGSAGIYQINPATGVTKLKRDLSDLNVEPIAGAIAQIGEFIYLVVKPEIDSTRRQLLRFKAPKGAPKLSSIVDQSGGSVLCNKIKPIADQNKFTCLASDTDETQVDVCRVASSGKTKCLNTLPDILRVGSGHTLLTADQKNYYAFVYAPDEPDNQRLIKFNAKGIIKANNTLTTIFIGGHFAQESAPE